jgi:hypothetical protein
VTELRHPFDPDPVRSTKATAVLLLGIAAAVTGPFVGGVVPATLALVLAREARGDLRAARGFLLGGNRVKAGVRLSWLGIVLALAALVIAAVAALLSLADSAGQDFAPTVN